MKYSIIIPHYNDHVRLERLIKSIPYARQDLEVIIVDDCSPYQLVDKLDVGIRDKVKIHSTTRNSGAGAARNIGLLKATADWVLFADSDDYFVSGLFDALDKVLVTEMDVVFFRATTRCATSGKQLSKNSKILGPVDDACLLLTTEAAEQVKINHVVPWGKVFRKSFIDENEIRFDEVRYSNDVMFSLRCNFLADNVYFLNYMGYVGEPRQGSLTDTLNEQSFWTRFCVELEANRLQIAHGRGPRISLGRYYLKSLAYGPDFFLKIRSRAKAEPAPLIRLSELKVGDILSRLGRRYKLKRERRQLHSGKSK
jgi:glycosyltransferase involved in cell wall biosynthesis